MTAVYSYNKYMKVIAMKASNIFSVVRSHKGEFHQVFTSHLASTIFIV